MDHVVDFVRLETKDLTEAAPDLIDQDHALQRVFAGVFVVVLAGSYHDGVVVVVPVLAGIVPVDGWVVPKDCAVGVPLADG